MIEEQIEVEILIVHDDALLPREKRPVSAQLGEE